MSDFAAFHGPNAGYVLELYDRFRADPQSVDAETRAFFANWTPPAEEARPTPAPAAASSTIDITRTVGAARLIRYIRELGHLDAHIDPLGSPPHGDLGLHLDSHGIDEAFLASLPAS
ncbi:MAG TPA: 2-oxoglutarate dehydrogenase E1 component, partial [Roseiflexaceae bacterium]|nr:2-oxoglutarate dehydrogenase E1 component [Roseiflexaceae bacterium]